MTTALITLSLSSITLENRTNQIRTTTCVFFRKTKAVSVATFNVRSINDPWKRESLAKDILRYGIDICCVQETKIKEDLDETVGDFRFLNLGSGPHHGLGFYVHKDFPKFFTLTNVRQEDAKGRIASLHLRTCDCKRLTILNVHAPTADKSEQDHLEFHEALDSVYRKYRSNQISILCGDFNAKVGQKFPEDTCVGSHTIDRNRTENGVDLVDFCERNDLFLCNTAFAQSERSKATHCSTNKNQEYYYRQIDYIICTRKMKGMLMNCRTHANTIVSDHRLLVARMDVRKFYGACEKHEQQKQVSNCRKIQYNIDMLKDDKTRITYQKNLSSKLERVMAKQQNSGKAIWTAVSDSIKEAAKESIGVKKKLRKKIAFIDSELAKCSDEKRKIHIDMHSCKNPEKRKQMKSERNRLLKLIRGRICDLRTKAIVEQVKEIDKQKDNIKTFHAIEALKQ